MTNPKIRVKLTQKQMRDLTNLASEYHHTKPEVIRRLLHAFNEYIEQLDDQRLVTLG